jgi:NAD(P)-dependent dehydrogenase (short-subunit alcohol dehydrogenase family)
MPLTGIKGKVVIVTGGANGIGKGTALLFAKEGAKVAIVTGHSVQKGEEMVKEIKGLGAEAIFIQCDVREEKQVEAMVAKTIAAFGAVDFAFNNAGVGPEGVTIPLVPLTDVEEKYWDLIIDTNLKGVFLCMKHELRQMRKQGHGVIVNTSSMGGLMAGPNMGGYGPSKAAVNYLTRMAAGENRDLNIRIHAVCPGFIINTGMSDRMISTVSRQMTEKKADHAAPEAGMIDAKGNVKNAGLPEDIGNVVVFLCSDQAKFVDGCIIPAAGNQMIA